MSYRDSISQIKSLFNKVLPDYSRIPLLITVILNFSVYWGARAIAGGWKHHDIETDIDRLIPVVYWTVIIYFGCYLFWIAGYIYNASIDRKHCYRFLVADWLAKVVCFICYIVYPTTNNRPAIFGEGICARLMRFLYEIDAADNLFPSIHCLVSWLCYVGVRGNKDVPRWIRGVFLVSAVAVFVSTLTTKQHVLYDVAAGILLVEGTYFLSKFVTARVKA